MPIKKTPKVESRFDRIDKALGAITSTLSRHNTKFTKIDKTLKAIINKLLEHDSVLSSQSSGIRALEEKVSHLPTKEEFYKMETDLLGEVKAEREENVVMQNQLSGHDDRIASIESKLAI